MSRGGYQAVEWVLRGAKRAELESWHLWRYNPALAEEGKNPFSLDSKEPNWANFHDLTSSSSVATQHSSSKLGSALAAPSVPARRGSLPLRQEGLPQRGRGTPFPTFGRLPVAFRRSPEDGPAPLQDLRPQDAGGLEQRVISMNSGRGFRNPLLYTNQKEHPKASGASFLSESSFVRQNERKTVFFRFCAHLFVPLHPIMQAPTGYIEDEVYGQRLLISVSADPRELQSNIRAARAILHSFADVSIIIRSALPLAYARMPTRCLLATRIQNTPSTDSLATARASWGKRA